MAYRWPAAVVLSSLVLAVTAAKLLSRPIPIAIKGGLQVEKLVLPPIVTIGGKVDVHGKVKPTLLAVPGL